MYNIKGTEELHLRIRELERQRDAEWKVLKPIIREQYERIRPANLIRNTFEGLVNSFDKDSDILKSAASVLAGLVANTVMAGSKNKELKRWVSLVIFTAATYLFTRHREEIVTAGQKLLKFASEKLQAIQKYVPEEDTDEDEPGRRKKSRFRSEDFDVMTP